MYRLSEIHHWNGKYVVTTEGAGRVLGTHDTEEEARKQLQAIEINKHKNSFKLAYDEEEPKRYKQSPPCNWCDGASTTYNPVYEYKSEIGVPIFRHPECQREAVPQLTAYILKKAVYPTLICDNPHCAAETDTGDENETDNWRVIGEPCLSCGRGTLAYKSAGAINYPGIVENPDNAKSLPRAQEVAAETNTTMNHVKDTPTTDVKGLNKDNNGIVMTLK